MENKESNVSKNNRKDIIYIEIIIFLIVIICTLIYLFVIKDNANNLQNDNNDKDNINEGLAIASINDEYVIGCLSASYTNNYYLQKTIKAEKSNDYIYLYDKALLCDASTVLSCMNIVSSNDISDFFSCYDDNDDVKSVCVENGNLDLKKTAMC